MLKHFLKTSIAIIIAFILFSVLTKISPVFTMIFNVFNLLVLYFALEEGEIYGAFIGSAAGLIQDSFSIGVFGIAGISKTILGFLAGYISMRINVVPFVRRAIFIFVMLLSEVLLWILLYSFVISEEIYTAKGLLFLQPVCTTALAFLVFPLFKKLTKALL
ncbi:MAG: rod shape-determining protein MreD [Candidatus Aminicenantes bacterium]|nr:rod shape-determining protein MreD [Candidatus Aminicenantes bacterium]